MRARLKLFELMASATTLVRTRVNSARVKKGARVLDRIELKPAVVADVGDDYALQEYGVTKVEMEKFAKRFATHIAAERKAGTIREVKTWRDLRG